MGSPTSDHPSDEAGFDDSSGAGRDDPSPEARLDRLERLLATRAVSDEPLRGLAEWLRAARIDAAGGGSYAGPIGPDATDRVRALQERVDRLIGRLEGIRREVEDELRTVRSQKAFERQQTEGPRRPWFDTTA
jgi:hypothetical protein